MNNRFFLVLLFIVLCSCDSSKSSNEAVTLTVDSSDVVHEVPLMRIIVLPEKYDKKIVQSIGFLAIDDGRLKVFPSKDSFLSHDTVSGITINLPYKQATEVAGKFANRYVSVSGRFSNTSLEVHLPRGYQLGVLNEVDYIIPINEKWFEVDEGAKEIVRDH